MHVEGRRLPCRALLEGSRQQGRAQRPEGEGRREDESGRGSTPLMVTKKNRKGHIHQDFRSKTKGTWCLRKEGRDRRESAKTWAAEN